MSNEFIWPTFVGAEPPEAAIEHSGIIALQAQEIQVDHSVSVHYIITGSNPK